MKSYLIVGLLLALASCGKMTTTTTTTSSKTYSLSSLQSSGVPLFTTLTSVGVACIADGTTTTQNRIDALTNFKASITSSKTISYSINGETISPSTMMGVLSDAIIKLQQYSNSNGSYSTQCPSSYLSQRSNY